MARQTRGIAFALLLWTLRASGAAARKPGTAYGGHHNQLDPFGRMADLVVRRGYPLEEHFVTTDDGYILRLFRIPWGRTAPPRGCPPHGGPPSVASSSSSSSSSSSARRGSGTHASDPRGGGAGEGCGGGGGSGGGGRVRRPVVHLQHGLLGAASDWVLNGPSTSLALILADAGYDVWLGNARANWYSRNHTALGPADAAFWAFTWDDIAARDLPAMLGYELRAARAGSLAYVGHSQGTTVLLALLAAQPEWSRRVHLGVLLAPVAAATHVSSTLLHALAALDTDQIFALLGVHEFLPSSEVLSRLDGQLCRIQPKMCVNLLAEICGYNPGNVDQSRLPVYLNYTPSGTSVANMAHWSQALRQPNPWEMVYFDFGQRCTTFGGVPRPCNQRAYGRLAPPRYDLGRVRTPLALFAGGNDRLSTPADVDILVSLLDPASLLLLHKDDDYEHLDYIWGTNAPSRVYSHVLQLLSGGPDWARAARRAPPGQGPAAGQAGGGRRSRGGGDSVGDSGGGAGPLLRGRDGGSGDGSALLRRAVAPSRRRRLLQLAGSSDGSDGANTHPLGDAPGGSHPAKRQRVEEGSGVRDRGGGTSGDGFAGRLLRRLSRQLAFKRRLPVVVDGREL